MTGNVPALGLRTGTFCLGALYNFSGVAEDVRGTQVQSETEGVARYYGPNAPEAGVGSPKRNVKSSLVMPRAKAFQ